MAELLSGEAKPIAVGTASTFYGDGRSVQLVPSDVLELSITEASMNASQAPPIILSCELNPPATAQLALTWRTNPRRPLTMVGYSEKFEAMIENPTRYAVTIENPELTEVGLNASTPAPNPFSITDWGQCAKILMPRTICRASLLFTPTSAATYHYSMVLRSNLPTTRIDLSRESIAFEPVSISATPATIDFGDIGINAPSPQVVTITNLSPIELSSILIEDVGTEHADSFSATGSCGDIRMVANEYCHLTIRYEGLENRTTQISHQYRITASYPSNVDPHSGTTLSPQDQGMTTERVITVTAGTQSPCTPMETHYDLFGKIHLNGANSSQSLTLPLSGELSHISNCGSVSDTIAVELYDSELQVPLFSFAPNWLLTHAQLDFSTIRPEPQVVTNDIAIAEFAVNMPDVYLDLFGLPISLARDPGCRLAQPIQLSLAGTPSDGAQYSGTLSMSESTECAPATSRVTRALEGTDHSFELNLQSR